MPAVALLGAVALSVWLGALTGLALLGIYALSTFVASLVEMGRRRVLVPFLPVAFATLHLGYALGFLAGSLRFANRWWRQGAARAAAGGRAS